MTFPGVTEDGMFKSLFVDRYIFHPGQLITNAMAG